MGDSYPNNNYPNNYNEYNYTPYRESFNNYLPLYLFMLMCFCSLSACLHEYYNNRINHGIMSQPLVENRREVRNETLFEEGCLICLERYKKNEKIITLKCDHIFHVQCIEEWLTSKKSCPLCRLTLS